MSVRAVLGWALHLGRGLVNKGFLSCLPLTCLFVEAVVVVREAAILFFSHNKIWINKMDGVLLDIEIEITPYYRPNNWSKIVKQHCFLKKSKIPLILTS